MLNAIGDMAFAVLKFYGAVAGFVLVILGIVWLIDALSGGRDPIDWIFFVGDDEPAGPRACERRHRRGRATRPVQRRGRV